MRLIAENLRGERGGRVLFSGIDLSLGEGDALVLSGVNGAGKSTLIRTVAGLLRPAAGRVRFEGGGEAFPTPAAACHYLGHLNAMKLALTVEENLSFWRGFLGEPQRTVGAALDMVGLGGISGLPFAYLSAGQRRRASIARLLVSRRPLWLLDEPTAGLDSQSEAGFFALLAEHRVGGGMVIAATHLPLKIEGAKELRLGSAGHV